MWRCERLVASWRREEEGDARRRQTAGSQHEADAWLLPFRGNTATRGINRGSLLSAAAWVHRCRVQTRKIALH